MIYLNVEMLQINCINTQIMDEKDFEFKDS